MAAAAIKYCMTSVTSEWDDELHDITLRCMITETMERVMQDDPVRGDIVWIKTPHSKCTDKLRMRHVTKIISLQLVHIDGVPHHVKDLQPVVGSKPSSDNESD